MRFGLGKETFEKILSNFYIKRFKDFSDVQSMAGLKKSEALTTQ